MNNKIKIALYCYTLITTALLIFLAVKPNPTSEQLEKKTKEVNAKIESLTEQINNLDKQIQNVQQLQKDTVKYYYTIDRSIINLDRPEQSSLFSANTKELLQKEREGYFDNSKP